MNNPPTIRDIAKVAGVNISTVSYALRDLGTVSTATRARIKAIAAQMNYHPNPLLASLAREKFKASSRPKMGIIYINGFPTPEYMNPLRYQTAHKYTSQLGYNLSYATLADLNKLAKPDRTLYNRGVGGILLDGEEAPSDEEWDWSCFTTVAITGSSRRFFNRVNTDHYEVIRLAWKQALSRGYTRIGLAIMRHSHLQEDDLIRKAASLLCLSEVAPRCRVPIHDGDLNDEVALLKWFEKYKPDCVIAFKSISYYNLRKVPSFADKGFICLHIDEPSLTEKISGIMHGDITRTLAAVNLLDQEMRHRTMGIPSQPSTILVKPKWFEGNTVRAVTNQAADLKHG